MKNRYVVISALVILAALGFTLALYSQLPVQVPAHWNAAGEIDRYGPRALVFVHTAAMVLILLLWMVLPAISPTRFKVDSFDATYWQLGVIVVCLLGYIQCVLVWAAYSPAMPTNRALFGGLAVALGLIGNVMGKVRSNFWIGIRTPWTLASKRVWYSTHRFAAKTMVTGAVLSLAAMLAGLPLSWCLALVVAGPIIPVFYSLLVYKRIERSSHLEN